MSAPSAAPHRTHWIKPLVFIVLAAAVVAACFYYRDELTPAALARGGARLREYSAEHPVDARLRLIAVWIVSTGLSIPSVITLSILSGWLLGAWQAAVLVSFASTVGATVAFLISRYLLSDAIRGRWQTTVKKSDRLVERDGAFYLLSLRLIHVIPSWLINLVMGCTKIRVWTFWWATQLGMLPSTLLYVYTGAHLPSLDQIKHGGAASFLTWPVIGAFVIMALLPLILKQVLQWLGWRSAE